MMVDAKRFREALSYDPITGDLRWRFRPALRKQWNGRYAGTIAGCPRGGVGYVRLSFDGRFYLVHRVIWCMQTGHWPQGEIDHVNGEPTDNRWSNLREATRAQNTANRRRCAPGLKGAYWDATHRRWFSRCKDKHIGMFDSPEAAHEAYCEEASRQFGAYARFK